MRITEGRIVKILGDIYYVSNGFEVLECSCLKTIRRDRLVIGDIVTIKENEYAKDKYIITKVLPRKNVIPRPYVANLDKLLIILAIEPKPDLLLVDKLVIYCRLNNIEPIIVINKIDLASAGFVESIHSQYLGIKIFEISAKNEIGLNKIKSELSGAFSAACGQSAVGKSSFINALMPNLQLQTQGLSEKISRGKHTTRVNEIFVCDDFLIADTPGFSSLDLNIDYKDLCKYYPEFEDYIDNCKYLDCSHIKEGKDCGVCRAISDGKINKDRYDRYIDLYQKLKEKWEKKYD